MLTIAFFSQLLFVSERGAQWADNYSFDRAVPNIYSVKVLLINFVSSLRKRFFFNEWLLIEDFEQCVLQKEVIIIPFMEWFLTTTLRKHYWATFSTYSNVLQDFFLEYKTRSFFICLRKWVLFKKWLKIEYI